jgi:hypothetical protein
MTFSFNRLGNLGHLGNQMFQYAAVKGLSAKHNRDFVVAPREFFGQQYPTLRSSIDDCFTITCNRGLTSFPSHEERHFHFDRETFENPPEHDVDLVGFFQSEKWFKHIEKEIRNDFTFKPEYFDPASEAIENLGGSVIGIHIRRTDFIPNNNHVSQNMEYFEKALEQLPEDSMVLIFSDDPGWCKQQQLFSPERFLVSETNNAYSDLCLITLCKYIVMANSTYSWWGAYLSNAEKVIAPKVWNIDGNPNVISSDIYCDDWIKL